MQINYRPLLTLQHELHGVPRGMERFRQYLGVTLNDDRSDVVLTPMLIMNPMGKEHVTALLNSLLEIDADGIAARAAAEAAVALVDEPGNYDAALVVVDDLMGGWTNRCVTEYRARHLPNPLELNERHARRFWITGVLWSSQSWSSESVKQEILTAIHRVAYIQRNGTARTLRDLMAQEGYAMTMAGCTEPMLDEEDIEYTREVLVPFLDAEEMPTMIECLFGDEAVRPLGFTPRGLSPRAALALALHDARSSVGQAIVGRAERSDARR